MSDILAAPIEAPPELPTQPIAPVWHTVVVLVFLLGVSGLGAYAQYRGHWAAQPTPQARTGHYVRAVLMEWAIVAFLWYGVRSQGVKFRTLIGERWTRPSAVLRDLGIGFLFLIGSNVILQIVAHLVGAKVNQAIRNLVPHSQHEVAPYLLLALTAGICEEIIFRGYLQTQFKAWMKNDVAALTLQGVIFGAAHGYQGIGHMIVLAVFGCLFGVLAFWRRSLIPGMMAHAMQDGAIGLLMLLRHSVK